MAYKGIFKPFNPKKYKGNPTNIIYRSRWELILMQKFDQHPDIVEWQSEEMFVSYRSPLDRKIHRYFPDFIIKKKNKDGTFETTMIEVKPFGQTQQPTLQEKVTRKYLKEVQTYAINTAKWKAAEAYCKERGYKFIIITERELELKF